jgi:hypothetical protein
VTEKKVFVEKKNFDAVPSALLKAKPIFGKKIEGGNKHAPKRPGPTISRPPAANNVAR